MTEEQQRQVTCGDAATTLVMSGLVAFLVKKGLVEEDEIITSLRRYVEITAIDASLREAAVEKVERLRGHTF